MGAWRGERINESETGRHAMALRGGRRIRKGQGLQNKPQSPILTVELIKNKHAHLLSKMWGVHQNLVLFIQKLKSKVAFSFLFFPL